MSSTLSGSSSMSGNNDFMGNVRQFFDGISKHTRGLAILLSVVFAIGLAFAFFMNHREARAEAARDALFLAYQTLDKEQGALAKELAPPPLAPAKDAKTKPESAPVSIAYKHFDVDAKLPESVKKLKAVASEFGGTRSAYEAKLALGDLYYDHGDPAKAGSWYQAAVSSAPQTLEKAFALYALGYSYENSGKLNEAVDSYQKAINLGEGALKGDLLMALGRSYENLHDTAKARSTYDQVLSQLPNTPYARSAELRQGQLH